MNITPRLTIELVPQSSWYDNVRTNVSAEIWDMLRKKVYKAAEYKCEICGGKGEKHPVECHEIWSYDETARLQKLEGLIALCPDCHKVKHFGYTTAVRKEGQQAFYHLCKVNNWDIGYAQRYVKQCFADWERRSKLPWDVDITVLELYGVPAEMICKKNPQSNLNVRKNFYKANDTSIQKKSPMKWILLISLITALILSIFVLQALLNSSIDSGEVDNSLKKGKITLQEATLIYKAVESIPFLLKSIFSGELIVAYAIATLFTWIVLMFLFSLLWKTYSELFKKNPTTVPLSDYQTAVHSHENIED